MITANTFVKVRNKKLASEGLDYGSILYVASAQPFPVTKSDQYTLRVKLFVHKMDGDSIDTKSGMYVIDPRSVKELTPEENASYMEKARAKYNDNEQGDLFIETTG
jgi:hypothetical protein